MSKASILEKLKNNRTRPAEIDGEPVRVKVYALKELEEIRVKLKGSSQDRDHAEFMSNQFFDESGEKIFTVDYLLSDAVPNVVYHELAMIFWEVNHGVYKKKE